jgi:oligopeptide/dipeptide ABC transporter ATP-binding protein
VTSGTAAPPRDPALELTDLNVRYGRPGDKGGNSSRASGVHAVRNACLTVGAGQVVALIGETGSGKSSLALGAAGLLPRSAAITGQITIAGRDVSAMDRAGFRRVRASLLGCIAQDAMAALNPVVPVGRQIGELFTQHAGMRGQQAAEAAIAALAQVEIRQPAAVAKLYPHQLSGGMRQRVMIAMAIALSPPLIVADEPTTALDVSTQAEILALIGELREGMRSGFLWITHDMGVVAELADWAAVMYAGRIVEQAPVELIFDAPAHPYTQGLLQTRQDLRAGAAGTPLFQIPGAPPAPGTEPAGCPFAPRCPRATQVCADSDPPLEPVSAGHLAACHHPAISGAAAETQTRAPAAPGPGGEGERS